MFKTFSGIYCHPIKGGNDFFKVSIIPVPFGDAEAEADPLSIALASGWSSPYRWTLCSSTTFIYII